ncbi:MAG TPA: phospholipase D family protein [Burkholderiaceae bacterium]|jgi:phosphatidylserine/phosphatidylglycerophosphate/cardiolipin synthase-like enzyme
MNRLSRYAIAVISCLIVATQAYSFDSISSRSQPIVAQGTLQAAFAPWDDVESLIIESIDSAKKQILVQAYLLTSKKIANALIAAHRRAVDVRVLVDAEQFVKGESSKVPELTNAGIPVWLETKYQNAHNKVIVIDATTADAVVITGSFNFTWAAQHKNAENILIARSNPTLASRYALNWERHQRDSSPYKK